MANQLGKFGHSCPPMVAKRPEETRAARGALLALRELLLLPWRETTRRSARRAAAEGGIRLWKERAILPAAMIDAVMCWWWPMHRGGDCVHLFCFRVQPPGRIACLGPAWQSS